jgi:hypothetical protein
VGTPPGRNDAGLDDREEIHLVIEPPWIADHNDVIRGLDLDIVLSGTVLARHGVVLEILGILLRDSISD